MHFDICPNNIFLDLSPQAREKIKINKWDYTKPKSFYTEKEPINRRKGHLLNERRHFQTMYLIKG